MADCDDDTLIWLSSSLTIGIVTAAREKEENEMEIVKFDCRENTNEMVVSYRLNQANTNSQTDDHTAEDCHLRIKRKGDDRQQW